LATRPLDEKEKEDILQLIDDFSSQAFRVLAIAYRTFGSKPDSDEPDVLEAELTFSALVCSIDPEREEVGPCIQKARDAGVRTVMITGDYVATAKSIAENIGIIPKGSPATKAIDCDMLREMGDEEEKLVKRRVELEAKKDPKKAAKERAEADKAKGIEAATTDVELVELTAEERKDVDRELKEIEARLKELEAKLDKLTSEADVYARALPKDKITIVRSLQRQENVCAMTGDGVNDAPALRQANIGVAMGITGTDVAKAAADMVLLNDSFVSITAAIEQGRITYANIQKFVFFLLSCNIGEVFIVLIAVIIGLPSPLVPTQILWLNLTTDILPALALAFEKIEPGVMEEGPRPVTEPFIEKVMLTGIAIQVVFITATNLGTYIIGLYWESGHWDGNSYVPDDDKDPNYAYLKEKKELHFRRAKTMTMLVLVLCELWRAYSVRSMRKSIWSLGFFSNKYMQPAVLLGAIATILFAVVPGMRGAFNLAPLHGREWGWVMGVMWIPFFVDELTKAIYRATGYGYRTPVVRRGLRGDPADLSPQDIAADDFKRSDGQIPD
jgi:magnesium-transporting ATPase (P-type)